MAAKQQAAAEQAKAEHAAQQKAARQAAAEKAAEAKAAAEKAAEVKAAAEAARAAALKKQMAEQTAKAEEAARAKALQQQLSEAKAKAQAEANLAAARAQQAAENQRLIGLFAQKIRTQVYNAWNTNFSAALSCTVQMELSPQGQIIGQPRIIRSSGNPRFDQAVIAAVQAAAPFAPPIGLSYDLYKEVNLKFNAEELNHG